MRCSSRADGNRFARSVFASNATEAYRLFRVAAQHNHTEALYWLAWGYEHGVGGLNQSVTAARIHYVRLIGPNATWAEALIGALSLARMGASHPTVLVPQFAWSVPGPVFWYLFGLFLGPVLLWFVCLLAQ